MRDPNPVYDVGAPRSTGGINNAAALCDVLEVDFKITPPEFVYYHGWGDGCHDLRPIVGVWEITVMDKNHNPCTFSFDLVEGDSTLVVGLDVGKFAMQNNLSTEPFLHIKRPMDSSPRLIPTYISTNMENNLIERIRVELVPRPQTCINSLLSATLARNAHRQPKLFAKRLHRLTHAPPKQISEICRQAGIMNTELQKAIEEVDKACDICASSGRPEPSKKISLSHINEAFNVEIQVDICFQILRGTKTAIVITTDTGTGYSEGKITQKRDTSTLCKIIEHMWILRHGAPLKLSADDEYNRKTLLTFLGLHNILFKARPTRRHNKTGIVERKIQTVKVILSKLDKEPSSSTAEEIVHRALFLSNFFSGSAILSSFQLVRGYQPSILGLPPSVVPQDLLDSHIEQTATRALQRAMRARKSSEDRKAGYRENDLVWVWYASTKMNEQDQWIQALVVRPCEHHIEVRRLKNGAPVKGPLMKPAYEDVRFAPKSELTRELLSCTLEEEFGMRMRYSEANPETDNDTHATNINALLSAQIPAGTLGSEYDIGEGNGNIPNKPYRLLRSRALRDIDRQEIDVKGPGESVRLLDSDKARVLEHIYETIGSKQVSRRQLEFAPAWIIDQAFMKEFDENWSTAVEEVNKLEIPESANIIRSHVVYKVKTDEEGKRKMKARLCPHGNEDNNKNDIRKDSANAQLSIIRLLLSITTFLGFSIITSDIKGAYLQSGPIKREIYVRPPKEWHSVFGYKRGMLWKLLKLPYGIVEAGRQWMLVVEDWLLSEAFFTRVFGISQLFVKRNRHGKIVLIMAKLTDDFLIAGMPKDIEEFAFQLKTRFEVGKIAKGPTHNFGGCEILVQENGDIILSMAEYWKRVRIIPITRSRRKNRFAKATVRETQDYRALAGTLLYLGNGVMPQASLVVSIMQQKIGNLKVEHLIDANIMVAELMKLGSKIIYRKVSNPTDVCLFTLSDAAHPRNRDYGQIGILTGILAKSGHFSMDVFHLIYWTSHKQQRVSHSSYGAEIIAAATADDRGYYIKLAITTLFPKTPLKHELNVDSNGLWDTVTTLHEGREYRLRQTVQRIRNSFESGETNVIRWIPGPLNISDALTKFTTQMFKKLDETLSSGYLKIDISIGKTVDQDQW